MAVIHMPDWMTPREFKSPAVRKYTLVKSSSDPGGANTNIDYEQKLNPQQRQVVLAGPGPMLVIAGAGSGIGRSVSLAFLNEGCTVVLPGRREDALNETIAKAVPAGERVLAVSTDVGDPASVQALFQKTKGSQG